MSALAGRDQFVAFQRAPRPGILTSGRDSPLADRAPLRRQPRLPGPETSALRASAFISVPELTCVADRQAAVLLFLGYDNGFTVDRCSDHRADRLSGIRSLLKEGRILQFGIRLCKTKYSMTLLVFRTGFKPLLHHGSKFRCHSVTVIVPNPNGSKPESEATRE